MCGRYYLDSLPEELASQFSVTNVPAFAPRYNVAPTDLMPIVVEQDDERRMGPARWGLIPFWARDAKIGYKTINARVESAPNKPAFREAWKRRRCLVPASGFYEWRKEGPVKQPYLIRPADGEPLAFAGLWERWKDQENEVTISYTIVTCPPVPRIAKLHDRMPLVLGGGDRERWLAGSAYADLDGPGSIDFEIYPVSRKVNSPGNDGPELIQRTA